MSRRTGVAMSQLSRFRVHAHVEEPNSFQAWGSISSLWLQETLKWEACPVLTAWAARSGKRAGMTAEPKYPWRLDTNDRYREVVRTVMGLSTASLLLPVFFAREFLGIDSKTALKVVLGASAYWSWGLLSLSIIAGIFFHYLSAKWARLAWEQPATVFGIGASERCVETLMEWCFWTTCAAFVFGLALIVYFFASHAAQP